ISRPVEATSIHRGATVSELPQLIVQLVGVARLAAVGEALQLQLEVGERARVDELAELFLSEQLGQDPPVERQRLRAPFGERRVAFVDERADIPERERARERRRDRRLDLDQQDLAATD